MDDEEDEDLSDDELAELKGERVVTEAKENGKEQSGGDLDKSLMAAKKNALKNTIPEDGDSSSDDDESESKDEESGEDIGEIDLEAEEGEDDDLESDDMEGTDSEEEAIMAKLAQIK